MLSLKKKKEKKTGKEEKATETRVFKGIVSGDGYYLKVFKIKKSTFFL
jgi:hypothetical protein